MRRGLLAAFAALTLIAGDARAGRASTFVPHVIAFWDARHGIAASGGALGMTGDGGRSWTLTAQRRAVRGLSVVPGTHHAWASDGRRLLRSTDRGRTWRTTTGRLVEPSFPTARVGWALELPNEHTVHAGALRRTTDGGRRWKRVNDPYHAGESMGSYPALVTRERGWLLCTAQPGAGMQGKAMYTTRDGGRTWSLVMDACFRRMRTGSGSVGCGGYPRGVAFAGGRGWLWMSRGNTWTTVDGGSTWAPLALTEPEVVEVESLSAVSGRMAFAVVRNGRTARFELRRTGDGGRTWRLVRGWRWG